MLQKTNATPDAKGATAGKPGGASMGKIFLLVGVAIVIFMASTAYSVHKQVRGSAQLAAIKETYFPVLQTLDANIVRIDKLQELYIQVVVAGQRELLTKTSDLATEADQAFADVNRLYPSHEADIEKLRADLKTYQDLANKVSIALLDQSQEDITPMSTGMTTALKDLRSRLAALRQSTYDGFVQTLADSQHDAAVILYMGLALGAMNLGFMVVLVFFIRKNVTMMAVIAEQNTTLELRVAERTAALSQKTNDINAMLQNMKLGVSTVIPGNTIHPEYSNYLRTIFSIDDLAGKKVIESLFEKSNLGVDVKDQVTTALESILDEDAMMFDFNAHLLVREMHLEGADGGHKIVQLDWSPIVNEHGNVDKVLLITQDVTHLRELELSSAAQKEELDIISKIIRISVNKFSEFSESAVAFIAANRRLIETHPARDTEAIAALFRNMHTIKGNARTFEFSQITDAAHRAEQTYDQLRKSPDAHWDPEVMQTELDAVEGAIGRFITVNEDKLGRKGRASDLLTTRGSFVSNEQLTQLRALAAAMVSAHPGTAVETMRAAIDNLGLIPLQRLVSGSVDSLSSLANELRKPTPTVDISNGDFSFNSQFAEALKSSFMHILRNSLDHGIESPEERKQAHKSMQGKVQFACTRQGDHVQLHVSDDGRGLALHKLYEKGLAAGMFKEGEQPSREDIAEVIFQSGLSTSERVTQVSGRGVGMEAVRTFLKEQGASIRIALGSAGKELGFTPFEFVIDIPPDAYKHAA
jgi:HPt (histidine-containing phosphotransfer) domain-containing protein